ncbi:shaking B isoform D [Danaus plexippus plexippus]|uniref:Innexin n=1 Tax=Danaus plexippus plexippus TaxID=278856 RepID=A0A212EW91_DANPL|nr:shaking B isoform D [Danaus plexippus plexippus]
MPPIVKRTLKEHDVKSKTEGAVTATVGGGARGAGSASAWRRRERLAQSRRPMEILTSLYALLSGGQGVNPKIDSVAFRLHCGATTAALLAASAALTTRHLVGNPIDCIHTRDIPEDVLNTYCWIHSTFTVAGEAGAYPGVRPAGTAPRRYGKYYQWVAFMLFLQVSGMCLVLEELHLYISQELEL